MKRIFNSIVSYIMPDNKSTIGLTSFKIKKQTIKPAPKPKIKDSGTLNFSLIHK